MASRATQNTNIDAALATIDTNLTTWLANGGSPSTFIRVMLANFASVDQSVARYVERRWGSSSLVGVKTTLTAGDTAP